jgi:TonB family protein
MAHVDKRILLCTFLLVSIDALAQPAKQPATWKRYTIGREEFSVMLPVHPAMASRKPLVMRLSKELQIRTLGAYAGGLAFTILSIENSSPRESLDDYLEQEIFTHSGWDRSSEKELTVNGFKGKQYIAPNIVPGTMQIFATRNHIYRFHAFGATIDDARVKQFFSSIILGPQNQGIEVKEGNGVSINTNHDNANAFSIKEVDRRPFIAFKPEPAYTDEARQNGVTGSVLLKAIFTADGAVTNIKVASGMPYGLEENAIDAAKKIRFIPAVKDGKFVSTWMQLEYNFNLY